MPRKTLLTLLVSDDEKKTLEQLADMTGGGGMSAYVRRLIHQEAKRLGIAVPTSEEDEPEPQP